MPGAGAGVRRRFDSLARTQVCLVISTCENNPDQAKRARADRKSRVVIIVGAALCGRPWFPHCVSELGRPQRAAPTVVISTPIHIDARIKLRVWRFVLV